MDALDQLATLDILFLNWRDPAHPQAGGAEVYCYEMARAFAAAGAGVTLFTARHTGSDPHAEVDGVHIVREGGTVGVYAAAARHLMRHRHAYDAVVDCQNGIPFFSPVFTPRWTADICVIHHVHQDQFDAYLPWPLSTLGRILEKDLSQRVYRGRPVVVVSPSTREESRRELGFSNPIYIVPNGRPNLDGPPKPGIGDPSHGGTPSITVVSRLVPHKRVDLLIRAVPQLLRHLPDLRVDICGAGAELGALRDLTARLGVSGTVAFHGHVPEERKRDLLSRAWLTVVPSVAEGWGLTVLEANAVGTPAVAFDVPGLRDAIQQGLTGWLLPENSSLADGVLGAMDELSEPSVRQCMADRCKRWSAEFSWHESAERLAAVVIEEVRRIRRHRRSRRRTCDLTVVTRIHAENPDLMEQTMRRCLRGTDVWHRNGDTFRLLLHGCDEVRALQALRRLAVPEAEISLGGLAHRQDILTGGGENWA